MPVPGTLKVCELFASFQGEGCRFGISSIFLRLSGCSIGCAHCDTPESWGGGEALGLDPLMERIDRLHRVHPHAQLVITGGEPLEQDILALVERAKNSGFFVALETSGRYFQDLPVDWWAVAPKAHLGFEIHPDLGPRIHEIKLVVGAGLCLEDIRRLRTLLPGVPIFLQPDVFNHGQKAYAMVLNLAGEVEKAGIKDLRLGMQLHRIYAVP